MGIRIAFLVAAVLVAVAAMIALAHVVAWPLRRESSVLPIVRAQRDVRRYGLFLGVVEAVALVALLTVVFTVPSGSVEMWLAGAAALCVALMIGLWAAWLRPLNATIAAWAPEELAAEWPSQHRRWTTFHRVRLTLAVIALALLLVGVLAQPAQ